jgi:hypothetical protein
MWGRRRPSAVDLWSNRTDRNVRYRFGNHESLTAGTRSSVIWNHPLPRSNPGLGWPSSDLAEPRRSGPFLFFLESINSIWNSLLDSKMCRNVSVNPKFVNQISMWSWCYCLPECAACLIFMVLEIICDLFVVDLGFYLHKSKSEVVCDEIDWFKFSEMPCCYVKL